MAQRNLPVHHDDCGNYELSPKTKQVNTTEPETKDRLPDKASELILLALKDLEACERDDDYEICMGEWHSPMLIDPAESEEEVCAVCLAGSVMAKSLGADLDELRQPNDFPEEKKLQGLNQVRVGLIKRAADHWEGFGGVQDYYDCIPYEQDPAGFKAQMRQIAADYAAIGQ